MAELPHVVIVGCGFGGLYAANALKRAPVRVTVIDRRNHHLFQPLLYQVAVAGLSPGDIAEPIRRILRRNKNAKVMLGQAREVDAPGKRLLVDDTWMAFDKLILATGSTNAYFGHDAWAEETGGLKTIGDALDVRQRMLLAYEQAEWTTDPKERERLLTFVVVGGGATGVEMAGSIAEIASRTIAADFRNIDTSKTRIVLVEAADSLLRAMPQSLQVKCKAELERMGVEVRLSTPVKNIDGRGVDLGDKGFIESAAVLWAAGVQATPIVKTLGVPLDRSGRVMVEPDLSVPGHPDIFVIGDLIHFEHGLKAPLAGVAQVAMQSGARAAKNIRADLAGKPRKPFWYLDLGTFAMMGRSRALAHIGPFKLGGPIAWLAWAFVHVMSLVAFRSRAVVMIKWAWAWFSWDASARLLWQGERSRPGVLSKGGIDLDEAGVVGSSRVDLQACKLEYSIVSPK